MSFEFAVAGAPSLPQAAAAAVEAVPAVDTAAGRQPALLPSTYVDPSSGVVVLQTREPGGVVTLPTPRQLDAYQNGVASPPGQHPNLDIAEA